MWNVCCLSKIIKDIITSLKDMFDRYKKLKKSSSVNTTVTRSVTNMSNLLLLEKVRKFVVNSFCCNLLLSFSYCNLLEWFDLSNNIRSKDKKTLGIIFFVSLCSPFARYFHKKQTTFINSILAFLIIALFPVFHIIKWFFHAYCLRLIVRLESIKMQMSWIYCVR